MEFLGDIGSLIPYSVTTLVPNKVLLRKNSTRLYGPPSVVRVSQPNQRKPTAYGCNPPSALRDKEGFHDPAVNSG